jgi:hypothetical protein
MQVRCTETMIDGPQVVIPVFSVLAMCGGPTAGCQSRRTETYVSRIRCMGSRPNNKDVTSLYELTVTRKSELNTVLVTREL